MDSENYSALLAQRQYNLLKEKASKRRNYFLLFWLSAILFVVSATYRYINDYFSRERDLGASKFVCSLFLLPFSVFCYAVSKILGIVIGFILLVATCGLFYLISFCSECFIAPVIGAFALYLLFLTFDTYRPDTWWYKPLFYLFGCIVYLVAMRQFGCLPEEALPICTMLTGIGVLSIVMLYFYSSLGSIKTRFASIIAFVLIIATCVGFFSTDCSVSKTFIIPLCGISVVSCDWFLKSRGTQIKFRVATSAFLSCLFVTAYTLLGDDITTTNPPDNGGGNNNGNEQEEQDRSYTLIILIGLSVVTVLGGTIAFAVRPKGKPDINKGLIPFSNTSGKDVSAENQQIQDNASLTSKERIDAIGNSTLNYPDTGDNQTRLNQYLADVNQKASEQLESLKGQLNEKQKAVKSSLKSLVDQTRPYKESLKDKGQKAAAVVPAFASGLNLLLRFAFVIHIVTLMTGGYNIAQNLDTNEINLLNNVNEEQSESFNFDFDFTDNDAFRYQANELFQETGLTSAIEAYNQPGGTTDNVEVVLGFIQNAQEIKLKRNNVEVINIEDKDEIEIKGLVDESLKRVTNDKLSLNQILDDGYTLPNLFAGDEIEQTSQGRPSIYSIDSFDSFDTAIQPSSLPDDSKSYITAEEEVVSVQKSGDSVFVQAAPNKFQSDEDRLILGSYQALQDSGKDRAELLQEPFENQSELEALVRLSNENNFEAMTPWERVFVYDILANPSSEKFKQFVGAAIQIGGETTKEKRNKNLDKFMGSKDTNEKIDYYLTSKNDQFQQFIDSIREEKKQPNKEQNLEQYYLATVAVLGLAGTLAILGRGNGLDESELKALKVYNGIKQGVEEIKLDDQGLNRLEGEESVRTNAENSIQEKFGPEFKIEKGTPIRVIQEILGPEFKFTEGTPIRVKEFLKDQYANIENPESFSVDTLNTRKNEYER